MKILKAIWAAIKTVIKAIVKFIKKYWWIILVVVAIYFAPTIAGWLSSAGAPSWLSGAFTWIGSTITPTLTSLVSWVASGAGSLWSASTSAWASLSFGQQLALGIGAVAALAPEETAAAIDSVGSFIGDTVATVGGAVASGLFGGNGLWLIGGGLALWWLLSGDDDSSPPAQPVMSPQGGAN